MQIVLNGEAFEASDGSTLLGLLDELSLDASHVAIELDGRIVKKAHWGETRLNEGSKVEVVHFVGGG